VNFDQALNKLQAGKAVNRSGWGNNNYLIILHGMDNIYFVAVANLYNPVSCYNANNTDLSATDWQALN
jgi:hypothetical protein